MSDSCADFELALRRDGERIAATVRFTPAGSSAPVRLIDGDPPHVGVDAALRQELLAASLDMTRYGQLLGAALFADPRLAAALARAWASAQSGGASMRMRLDLDDRAPELHALAWETLPAPPELGGAPLATNERLRVARFLSSADMQPVVARPRGELRALLAVAAPDDLDAFNLAPIDVAGELARARAALGDIPTRVLARGESEPVTLDSLAAALREGPDLLYLACHGSLHRDQPFLWLEDADGLSKRVPAQALVDRLQALERRPLLVALASCESAGGRGSQATLLALGPRLAAAGVAAVVGMQGNVTMSAVAAFMPVFFRELLRDGLVDRAVAAARAALLAEHAWWQPVLWMRSGDGRLWGAAPAAAAPEPPREAPTNLPSYPDALLGRAADQEAITGLLGGGTTRLLSLLGPGGIGKTRLAAAVGWQLRPQFADGVFLAQLAALREPGLMAPTLAHIFGVRDDGSQPLEDLLVAWLRGRELLLILDNLEHLPGTAPLIGRLLRSTPRLAILATSRAALHVSGEHEYVLGPLALPARDGLPRRPAERLAALRESPAVALFVARAAAVRPGFELDTANAGAVAAICIRLDGLPLAIELAAARVKLLTPKALFARLSSRLSLLTGGARDLPTHQQTMRGAITWSYDLLDPPERALFAALSVFDGGCTLDAAEVVCAVVDDLGVDVLDGLGSLVDKSLLAQTTVGDDEPRFSMLAIIREFAQEQLELNTMTDRLRYAHAAYYLAMIRAARDQIGGVKRAAAIARYDREHDNLVAAIDYYLAFARRVRADLAGPGQRAALDTLDHERASMGAAVAAGAALKYMAALAELAKIMSQFWYIRGHFSEGRQQIAKILEIVGTMADREQALVFSAAAVLALGQGDLEQAGQLFERQLAICRALPEQGQLLALLNNLGIVARRRGNYAQAQAYYAEGLLIARATGHRPRLIEILNNLGALAVAQNDNAAAEIYFNECLDLVAATGDRRSTAHALHNLALARRNGVDPARSEPLFQEALAIFEEVGDVDGVMAASINLGAASLARGQLAEAQRLLARALQLGLDVESKERIAECLDYLARLAARDGSPLRAARWWGAAAALREIIGAPLPPVDLPEYERARDDARAAADPAAFAAAWAEGRTLAAEQAASEALDG